jgi:hypothetical protein
MAIADNTSDHLDKASMKHIQEVVGVILFYAHAAIDNTMSAALSSLAATQAKAT